MNGVIFASIFVIMNKKNITLLSIICFCAPVFLLCYGFPVSSAERDYVVPMTKAQWISTGKKYYECSLSQTIPFYGEGEFIHKSGRNVVFNLFSNEALMSNAKVIIQSEPPSWRHDKVFEIGRFILKQGHNPLVIETPYASRMLQEVENGMSPIVLYRDLTDDRDLISIFLSPINFRDALNDYLECEKTLMDFDTDEIKNFKLYFATNKAILEERSKRDLKNVVRYLAIDPAILQIKIDAHADARGRRRYNDKLSERRSQAVIKYLLSVGAKQEMLYAVSHGERQPAFTNKTIDGRAHNRRADIQLLAAAPPTAEQQEALEQARKEQRRRRLFEKSIYEGVPKNPLQQNSKPQDKAEADKDAAEFQTSSTNNKPEVKSDPEPIDDEPPAPNFINFDHLVDKNNRKLKSQ